MLFQKGLNNCRLQNSQDHGRDPPPPPHTHIKRFLHLRTEARYKKLYEFVRLSTYNVEVPYPSVPVAPNEIPTITAGNTVS